MKKPINTGSEVKQNCIEWLEKLIADMKNDDDLSDGYSFTVEIIESETIPTGGEVCRYRYSLERNEYKIIA